MEVINPYPSDVKAMSDEELSRLSEELHEAYLCTDRDYEWGDDESYWTDDAAEARYYEMRREINRRWREANPEKAAQVNVIARSCLSILMNQLTMTRHIVGKFDATEALKVGQTTKVRMPFRYVATDWSIQ